MVNQDIPFPDRFEDAAALCKFRDRGRLVRRSLVLVEAREAVHFHADCEIQRTRDVIDPVLADLKFLLQDFQQLFVDALLDLKTDYFAPLALFQLLLDLKQQVLRLFLIDGQVGIPHDAVRAHAVHVVVLEQHVDVMLDDFLEEDPDLMPVLRIRQPDDTGQHGRNLDSRKFLMGFFLFLFQQMVRIFLRGNEGADVERFVLDKREGPR